MAVGVVRSFVAMGRPVDWLMVATLVLLVWFEIWIEPIFQTGMPGPRLPLTLLAAVAVLPLLVRRAFPLTALIVMCLGFTAVGIVGDNDQSTFVLFLALLVGTYALAAHATARNALIGAALVVASAIIFEFLTSRWQTLVDAVVPMLFLTAAWIVGKEVHRQRERAGELVEHATLLARTHQLEMHAAVVAERTRIARELHDVVAHAISVMGIQAGAARRTLAPQQQEQHDALLDVERLGRQALDEMQRMLGVLRTGEEQQGVGPLPDLSQIGALAAAARGASIEVDLNIVGHLDDLPPGLELTAYRIIQEALTNVRKHAQANRVCITVSRCRGRLDITVADDGNGTTSRFEPGNGLIGMRERVAMHDGNLYAGSADERGFVIRARLPVTLGS